MEMINHSIRLCRGGTKYARRKKSKRMLGLSHLICCCLVKDLPLARCSGLWYTVYDKFCNLCQFILLVFINLCLAFVVLGSSSNNGSMSHSVNP